MTSRRTRPRRMLLPAAIVAVSLTAAACSVDPEAAFDPVGTTAPATSTTTEAPPDAGLSADRVTAIEAWTNRPLVEILSDGFDTTSCVSTPDPGDSEPATVHGLGWAFLPLPLEVVSLERSDGDTRPAIDLTGDEIHPNPIDGYTPTHALLAEPDISMLDALTGAPASSTAEVVLGISPTDQGRGGRDAERSAFAPFAWLLTDDAVIPFSGECDWIATFAGEVGDPLTELPLLRTDAYRRAELAGLTGDELDFGRCQNPEPALDKRVGFGGDEVGLAYGPWPADAATFTDIELDGWTVLPPTGEETPEFAERFTNDRFPGAGGSEGFPDGKGLDPDGWLFLFTVEEGRAIVHTLFSTDPVLGLRIWSTEDSIEERACFEARQVLAFREFLDDAVPDRPAWDLSPALPGAEAVVIETLRRLMTDADTRERFREWTPCTYKLCELNNEVER